MNSFPFGAFWPIFRCELAVSFSEGFQSWSFLVWWTFCWWDCRELFSFWEESWEGMNFWNQWYHYEIRDKTGKGRGEKKNIVLGARRLYSVILFLKVERDLSGLPIDICFHNFSTYMYTYHDSKQSICFQLVPLKSPSCFSLYMVLLFFPSIVTLHEFLFITAKEVVYKWHVVTVTAWPWFKTKNPWRNMSTPGVWAHLVSWAFLRSSCRTILLETCSVKRGVLRFRGVNMVLRYIIS